MNVKWVGALLAGALLAGCAQGSQTAKDSIGSATPDGSTAVGSAAPAVGDTPCSDAEPVHLPPDAGRVSSAYVCTTESRAVAGDGTWNYLVVKRVTGGLDELLRVYATPDAALGHGMCTADLPDPRVVWVQGSDTLPVRAPRDSCGKPTKQGIAAFDAMLTVEVSATKTQHQQTQLSQDSNCPDEYKDMLSIEGSTGDPKGSPPHPTPLAAGSTVCLYTTEDPKDETPVGRLTSARALTAEQVDALNQGLASAVVDPSCSRADDTRFAVINMSGSWTLVAMDGCAVQQEHGWWRAGNDVRAALAS